MKLALSIGDGTAMCHLTDDMSVADGAEAVGGDHIAVEIHVFGFAFVTVLGNGGEATQHQDQYE